MATFAGFKITGLDWTVLPGLSDSFTGEHPIPENPRGLWELRAVAAGTLTENRPLNIRSLTYDGAKVTSYFDDFYNVIHISPKLINFGAITGGAAQAVTIWNAHLADVELTDIDLINGEGLALAGSTPPVTFKALATKVYNVVASVSGPPVIDARVDFNFASDETVSTQVLGTRSATLDFQINWSNSYRISYEFKTDMTVSRSGREQRRALRSSPRKSVEYKTTLPLDELRRFNRLLASWHHRSMNTYEATRFVTSPEGAPAYSDVISVAEVPPWLIEGAQVALSAGPDIEFREVETISENTITFVSIGTRPWPAGTRLHPALSCNLVSEIKSSRITNHLATATVNYEVVPASEPVVDYREDPMTFYGRELFLVRPNWVRDVDWTYQHDIETVDYGRGRIERFLPIEFETNIFEATYLARNSDEAETLRRFFERMEGQVGEFYMPSWQNDLPLRATAFANVNTLRIVGSETFTIYETDTVHRAVAVFLRDGRVAFGKISEIYRVSDIVGTDTILEMEDVWDFQIDPENVLMICWMPVWRHATDTLTIEWLSDSVAQTKFSLKTLEALPVDAPAVIRKTVTFNAVGEFTADV